MPRVIGRLRPDCLDLRGFGVGAIESFSVRLRILRHAQDPEDAGAWQGVPVKKKFQDAVFPPAANNRPFRSAYKPLAGFD